MWFFYNFLVILNNKSLPDTHVRKALKCLQVAPSWISDHTQQTSARRSCPERRMCLIMWVRWLIFPSILYTIPLLNHKYNILVPQFNGLRWIFFVEGIDKQRCRPRCLSSKAIIGDLSMTPDRRKTLVFSQKSQETCPQRRSSGAWAATSVP